MLGSSPSRSLQQNQQSRRRRSSGNSFGFALPTTSPHLYKHHNHSNFLVRGMKMCLDSTFVRGNRLVRRECCGKQNGYRIKVGFIGFVVLAVLYIWELLPEFLYPQASKSKWRSLPSTLSAHHVKSLDKINEQLEQMSLTDVITWAHGAISSTTSGKKGAEQLVHVTSFGPSGMVILHAMDKLELQPSVPIITIDTLHLFPETYSFIERLQKDKTSFRHSISVSTYKPKFHSKSRQTFDDEHGAELYKTNYERYAYLTKIEPTVRALEQHNAKAWITGRRRSQGGERTKLSILEVDEMKAHDNSGTVRFKLNPLANWSYDQVWEYIRKHKVPYNPLHDKGYKSIGDEMTTKPVDKSADERSGRFADLQKEGGGQQKSECGMHSIRAKALAAQKAAAIEAETGTKGIHSPSITDDNPLDSKKKKKKKDSEDLPCTGCLELNPHALNDLIADGKTDVLLEFHSPLCGHCRDFAPKYEKVAQQLLEHASIDVARFDMTYQQVPQKAKDLGMTVPATPALFLLTRLPELEVKRYKGMTQTPTAIMDWLKSNLDYLK